MTEGAPQREPKRTEAKPRPVRRSTAQPPRAAPSAGQVPQDARQCPSPLGFAGRLIVQMIEPATCLQRQRDFYHKCHRCLFRGKAADYALTSEEMRLQKELNAIPQGAEGQDGVHLNGELGV